MAFPAAGYVSNAARTAGEMKTAFEDWLAATKKIPGAGAGGGTLTIASGSVTPTAGIHAIETEGFAATDDLATINPTNLDWRGVAPIRNVALGRTVVLKHAAGGTGQLSLGSEGNDIALADPTQWVLLKRSGSVWEEVFRSGYDEPQDFPALTYTSATQLLLSPGALPVFSRGAWRRMLIPQPGLTLGTGGLSASTLYYVYAFDNFGTVLAEFSTTARSSFDGVACKGGDLSRTLVGLVRTTAATQFLYGAGDVHVLSWFRRRQLTAQAVNATASTTSTGAVAIGTQISWLTWGEEDTLLVASGTQQQSTATQTVRTTLRLNGGLMAGSEPFFIAAANSQAAPFAINQRVGPFGADAFHASQLFGHVTANTGTWWNIALTAQFRG